MTINGEKNKQGKKSKQVDEQVSEPRLEMGKQIRKRTMLRYFTGKKILIGSEGKQSRR